MAIEWDVKITPQDVLRKTASIVGTRTDTGTGEVVTLRIDTAILNTAEQKLAARQQLRAMYLAHVIKKDAIAEYIGSMEADAKAWLEAQE